ncbi:MAG: tetratricopeptide repeat protein [Bacteroidia bacterium]
MNVLNESRVSVIINAKGASENFVAGIQNLFQKSKLDIEVHCLNANAVQTKSLDEWIQKGKFFSYSGNETLGLQAAQAAEKASGAHTLFLADSHHQISNLVQGLNAFKKSLNQASLLVLNQTDKNKKTASGRIKNAFTRIFTPLNFRDHFSGALFAKTNGLNSLFANEFASCNNWLQILYAIQRNDIPFAEVQIQTDKPNTLGFPAVLAAVFGLRFHYFISDSLFRIKSEGVSFSNGNHAIYRIIYIILFALAFFFMPMLSQDFGSTWDEKAHNDYSQLAYRYLTTFGADTAALAEPANSAEYIRQAYRFYGEQINTVSAFAYNWLGTGVFETRHFINSLYGFLGLVFVSLIAFELASWRAAVLALLFMFFNPGWFGNSMNNPTDIPFALGFAFSGLFLIKVLRKMPFPKFSHELWLGLGIGMGIASRVGALLIIAYFGLFLAVLWLSKLRSKKENAMKLILPYAKIFLVVSIVAYIVGILVWPYALNNPITHPYQAYAKASENAFYTNNVELFEGKRMYMLTAAPWYYVVKFLGIGNPLYLILGFIGSILTLPFIRKEKSAPFWLMLIFMSLFPIAYAELSNLNYYNGWRHYLFILSSAVPLAAVFYDYLLSRNKFIAIGATVVLGALFVKPTMWFVQNHPNQYVYFNELTGGLKGAFGTYETDYYSNSCREAAEWIANQHPKDSLVIGINNEITTAAYWAHQINPRLNFVWTRESEEQKQNWDYLIMTSRTFSQHELLNGSFPPKGTVYTVMADGVPLAAVVKRENNFMPLGYIALEKNNLDSAIWYFENAVRYADKDEETWRMLGFSLINKGRLDSAEQMLKKAIEIYPENFSAWSNLGIVHFNRRDFAKANEAFAKSTQYKENVTESWYYSGLAYMNLGDYNSAIKQFEMGVKHSGSIPELYYYLAKCYEYVGSLEKASDTYQMALSLNQNYAQAWFDLANVFTKLGKADYAAQCMQRYKALGGN